jgi:hypothetical protein
MKVCEETRDSPKVGSSGKGRVQLVLRNVEVMCNETLNFVLDLAHASAHR